ncbi:ATP-binding protein [Jatrophihabitans sp. DSM 45814]
MNPRAGRRAGPIAALEWASDPPIWTGDGRFLEAPDYYWGAAAVELLAAPRLEAGQQASLNGHEHRQLAARIVRSLQAWQNAGSLELRYIWGGTGHRLRVLIIGRALGSRLETARSWAGQMVENAVALFPPGYEFSSVQSPLPAGIESWVEIERAEETRATGPFVPTDVASYYYLIHPLGGSGSGWPSLANALASIDQPGFLSIVLLPTAMTDLERRAVDHVCSIATHLAAPQQTYDFFGNQIVNPPDAGAQAVLAAWQRFPERMGVLARIGVAAPRHELQRIASLVGSIVTEGTDQSDNPLPAKFSLVNDVSDSEAWQTATLGLVFPRRRHPVWSMSDDQAPITLERMPYFFSEQEAAGLLMLPVPDEQGVAGMPLSRRAAVHRETVTVTGSAAPGLHLGSTLHRGRRSRQVVLPLAAINRHALIVGASGSGKTTTVLSLLVQLWRDFRIPFLVIESVKTEYRSLLGTAGLDELLIVTLGNEGLSPLRLNPLDPPAGVRCEIHQSAIIASLKMALPLFPPQPEILAKALPETYYRAGWDDDTTGADGVAPPTLRDLMNVYQAVFDKAGYEGEARNIGRAFKVRLESLLQGSRGKLLDTVRSSDFPSLMARPTVIEMNDIHDADEKAVLAAFVLDRVRSAAKRRGSTGGQLRHVTVVEEAHRLLAKGNLGSDDAASTAHARADSVRGFCEAIGELRSLGEGFILSSQSPGALADAAVANTGTRILHRMESSVDRNAMLDDLDASDQTREITARLTKGEAIARWPEQDEIELVQVEPSPGVDSGRQVPDETVIEHMGDLRRQTMRLLPYSLCASEICATGCRTDVRRAGGRIADELGVEARELWRGNLAGTGDAVRPILELLSKTSDHDVQRAYCGAVHLSINGDAFRLRPGIDDRPTLIQSAREVVQDQHQ